MKTITTAAALLAATAFAPVAASADTVMKWGDHLPPCCSMYAEASKWLAEEVDRRSGGTLSFDINWGGVLATVGEIPMAIETGIIDIGNIVTPYFPDQLVVNNAIPFFWPQSRSQRELGELMLTWSEEIPDFSRELAAYNARLITVRPLPPYGLICTKPIRTLEDFKGKRIRTFGVASPAVMEALGAVSVGLPDNEAYEAMSNNIIDCSLSDIPLVEGYQLDEVGKYFVDIPMGASWGHIIAMNLDKYEALSDEHKALLDELKDEHLDKMLEMFEAEEARLRAKWAEDGSVEIIPFPADEFLAATLGDARVQAVRGSWKERAMAAGMAEADAQRVVDDITAD